MFMCLFTIMYYDDDLRATERALIYTNGSEFRQFAFDLVESRWFNVAILIVIFINTIVIGIQTSTYVMAKAGKCILPFNSVHKQAYFIMTHCYRVVSHTT